ncbi:hypothetical protein N7468_009252 [Penicillium chermesinum]|uniref:Transmembrane protein n=1 Tax=Penicillium chermesinum TaxID=63820 RepID=A0A9W9NHS1_9EURO|nr:uncharacterized protein N7468_009252 [Penicillium chermesinum]KAJ5220048.1 hypothetical protein N7468_009252 [Penicillium chermesinum]
MASTKPTTYFSGGRVLESPPLSVRLTRFFEGVYIFLGLYFVSLFSFDPYGSARDSQFNINNMKTPGFRPPFARGSGSSGGGGGGGVVEVEEVEEAVLGNDLEAWMISAAGTTMVSKASETGDFATDGIR